MAHRAPARETTRRIRRTRLAGLLIVLATIAATLGDQFLASSSSSASSSPGAVSPARDPRGGDPGALGEADGAVPAGTTVFDGAVPGVAGLDPALLGALRRAAADAAGDGVEFVVDSGWRSAAYQERLLRDAVSKYGSEEEALRWVATPATSAHVTGDAIDLGSSAAAWLSGHGAAYGLCQVYANEPWHYERRPGAVDGGCPPMYPDPTLDPRMLR